VSDFTAKPQRAQRGAKEEFFGWKKVGRDRRARRLFRGREDDLKRGGAETRREEKIFEPQMTQPSEANRNEVQMANGKWTNTLFQRLSQMDTDEEWILGGRR
jgi:hypothetical protein